MKFSQSIKICVPVMYLALFFRCLGYTANKNKDPSFHSGEEGAEIWKRLTTNYSTWSKLDSKKLYSKKINLTEKEK